MNFNPHATIYPSSLLTQKTLTSPTADFTKFHCGWYTGAREQHMLQAQNIKLYLMRKSTFNALYILLMSLNVYAVTLFEWDH